jgi:hypothetical protein
MKKLLTASFILLHGALLAQVTKPLPPVRLNPQYSTPKDTIITKDPSDPDREYWVIKNANDIVVQRGELVNGKRNGIWREYNNAGTISHLDEFRLGVRQGYP